MTIEATPIEHALVVAFVVAHPLYGALTWPAFVRERDGVSGRSCCLRASERRS